MPRTKFQEPNSNMRIWDLVLGVWHLFFVGAALLDGLDGRLYHSRNKGKARFQEPRTKFHIYSHLEIGSWKLVLGNCFLERFHGSSQAANVARPTGEAAQPSTSEADSNSVLQP